MRKNPINWDGVQKAYEHTELSLRAIGQSYNVHHSTILKKVKKYDWKRIAQAIEVTKKVTTVTTAIADKMGEETSDHGVINRLRQELAGTFELLFFDIVREEMSKKYYTYDYFSVFIAAEYFQRLMDVRRHVPTTGTSVSKNGQTYVSGETNVYISMANNFVKVTKDLGLSPLSRGRATLKMVQETKTKTLFDIAKEANHMDIDV